MSCRTYSIRHLHYNIIIFPFNSLTFFFLLILLRKSTVSALRSPLAVSLHGCGVSQNFYINITSQKSLPYQQLDIFFKSFYVGTPSLHFCVAILIQVVINLSTGTTVLKACKFPAGFFSQLLFTYKDHKCLNDKQNKMIKKRFKWCFYEQEQIRVQCVFNGLQTDKTVVKLKQEQTCVDVCHY